MVLANDGRRITCGKLHGFFFLCINFLLLDACELKLRVYSAFC